MFRRTRTFCRRIIGTLSAGRVDRDLDDELRFHIEMEEEQLRRLGTPDPEAKRTALGAFGGVAQVREQLRDRRRAMWLEDLGQDIRYAVRVLRRAPIFTVAALGALTLGIGANTAMFSLVNAVLLKPPPYPDPDRIVTLGYTFQGASVPVTSPAKFAVWRRHADAFQDIAAFRGPASVTLADDIGVEQIASMQVSADFFRLFDARVVQGRAFSAEEDRPYGEPVAVLGGGAWQRRFGGDPYVVGKTIVVDGRSVTIVGILDPTFDTTIFGESPDVWVPLRLDPDSTDHPPSLTAVGRLKPGVRFDGAQAQAQLVGHEFHRQFPDASGPEDTFTISPFQEVMVRNVRVSLLVLAGAVSFVLLIACANVANLLVVRASVRQRELAIRAAIGASRWRIVRQLLAESVLLSLAGGMLGLACGMVGMRALLVLSPTEIPRVGPHAAGVTLDWRVLVFTLLVSLITAVVFGVWPAVHASTGTLSRTLTAGGARAGAAGPHPTARSLLVVGEVGLALVLLVGAALFIRTAIALQRVDRGFNPDQLLTVRLPRTESRLQTTAAVAHLVRSGVRNLVALPGVISAAVTCCVPLESDWLSSVSVIGRAPEPGSRIPLVRYRIISSTYFDVLRIPLLRGRAFTERDTDSAAPVAIISQAMARRFWPDRDPLGAQLVAFPGLVPDDEPIRHIVGVVADVRDGLPLDAEQRPTIYVPIEQLLDRESAGWPLAWIIRMQTRPQAVVAAIQQELRHLSGGLLGRVMSMDAVMRQSRATTHFNMILLVIFAGSALLLAAIGLYGVMAYTVEQRTHEIGVRLALGATAQEVRNLVVSQGMKLVTAGIILGVGAAFGLTRILAAFLFGVTPHDRAVFIAAPLLLAVVAFVAVWWPARRATLIDPTRSLRHE